MCVLRVCARGEPGEASNSTAISFPISRATTEGASGLLHFVVDRRLTYLSLVALEMLAFIGSQGWARRPGSRRCRRARRRRRCTRRSRFRGAREGLNPVIGSGPAQARGPSSGASRTRRRSASCATPIKHAASRWPASSATGARDRPTFVEDVGFHPQPPGQLSVAGDHLTPNAAWFPGTTAARAHPRERRRPRCGTS